jgi:RecB family endonuclease NucS
VIELKRKGSDKAVGQICRYLGWVQENLCKGDQKVKGLIITQESDSKLEYALQIVPSVTIKYLKVTFNLSDKPV